MRINLFFCFLLISLNGFSQWIKMGLKSAEDFETISSSGTSIYIGGKDSLFISNDDGVTWNAKVVVNEFGETCYITDLQILNSSTYIAIGWMYIGNSEVVMKTTNGGNSWTTVNVNNNGDWPHLMNDLSFPSSTIGFSVGTNGRILKTINGGSSWQTQSSGVKTELSNVQALTTTKVYASGNGLFFKTTNGGTNWLKYSIRPGAKLLSMVPNGNGFAASSTKVFKTSDDGVSWIGLSTDFSSISAIYALNKDTVLLGSDGKLFVTKDGGQVWERTPNFFGVIKKIYFKDNMMGYIACENGISYKTSNMGGNTYPICSFSTSNTSFYCKDVPANFFNQSSSAYSFQWLVNGVFKSSSYNFTTTFSQGDQSDTVSLVAYNGFYYDTCSKIIAIQPGLGVNNFSIVALEDTLCPNTKTVITVLNSQPNTSYKLSNIYKDQVGIIRIGNGDTLNFPTENLSSSITYTITAWRSNSCGMEKKNQSIVIHSTGVNLNLPLAAVPPNFCNGSTNYVRIAQSQLQVTYQLSTYTGTLLGSPVKGNGDTIYLKVPNINSGSSIAFYIIATHYLGCGAQMSKSVTFNRRNLKIDFNSSEGTFTGDSILFTNKSNVESYQWKFDTTSLFPSSTAINASTRYNSIGEKTITLIGNAIEGCSDSIKKNIFIFDTISNIGGSNCNVSHLTSTEKKSNISAMHVDNYGNLYLAKAISKVGTHCYINGGLSNNFRFEKYDKFGNLKWSHQFSYNAMNICQYSYITGITSDNEGNVYISGQYRAIDFSILGLTITNTDYSNLFHQAFIIKLDSSGIGKWAVYTDYVNYSEAVSGASDIQFYKNKLYVAAKLNNGKLKMANDSNYSIPYTSYGLFLLVINKNGLIEKCIPTTDPNAKKLLKIFNSSENQTSFVNYPKIKIKNANEFILYNQTNVAVVDSLFNFKKYFPTFFNVTSTTPLYPSVTFDSTNNVYVSTSWDYTYDSDLKKPYGFLNGKAINNIKGTLIAKYNLLGDLLWFNVNPHFTSASIVFSNKFNILLFGYFSKSLTLQDQNGHYFGLLGNPVSQDNKKGDGFVASISQDGMTNWIKHIGYITNPIGFSDFLSSYNGYYNGSMAAVSDKCGKAYFVARTDSVVYINNDTIQPSSTDHFLIHFSENNSCNPCPISPPDPDPNPQQVADHKSTFNNTLNIYPNPANERITVDLSNSNKTLATIKLINILGETMLVEQTNEAKYQLDLSKYPNGVYLIQVQSNNSTSTNRIVVQR